MAMKYAIYIGLLFLLIACGSSKTYTAQEDRAYQTLQDFVASQNIEIVSYSARPMATNAFMQVANSNILGPGNSAANINIGSNPNRLRIMGDSIQAYLPFFGEQHFGGTPGSNHQGIEFNDVPDDLKIINNDAKHAVEISFNIEDQYRGNERYNVFITLFPNKSSVILVQSTNRTAIEYAGNASAIEEDKVGK